MYVGIILILVGAALAIGMVGDIFPMVYTFTIHSTPLEALMPKVIAIVLIAVILGYFLFVHETPTEKIELSQTQKSVVKEAKPVPTSAPYSVQPELLSPPEGIINIGIAAPYAQSPHTLFVPSEEAQIALENSDVLPSDLADEVFIAFNRQQISALRKKSRFTIPIPQLNSEFEAVVDDIVTHRNGDKTVRAKLTGVGEDYSVTITQGDEATYATIGTPEGVFVLEAQGENGWVAPRTSMRGNHNYTVTDAVVPPIVPQPEPPVLPQNSPSSPNSFPR